MHQLSYRLGAHFVSWSNFVFHRPGTQLASVVAATPWPDADFTGDFTVMGRKKGWNISWVYHGYMVDRTYHWYMDVEKVYMVYEHMNISLVLSGKYTPGTIDFPMKNMGRSG